MPSSKDILAQTIPGHAAKQLIQTSVGTINAKKTPVGIIKKRRVSEEKIRPVPKPIAMTEVR